MVLKGIIFGFQSNGELRLDECLNLALWPFKGLSALKGTSWLGGWVLSKLRLTHHTVLMRMHKVLYVLVDTILYARLRELVASKREQMDKIKLKCLGKEQNFFKIIVF